MKHFSGNVFIWFSVLATLNLFVLAKINGGDNLIISWLYLSQLLALLGTVLLSISFFLAGRFQFLESWFGGLDVIYRLHHLTGGVAFVLLLHHPLFLAVNVLPRLDLAWKYLWFSSNIAYDYGIIGLYLMLLLLIFTLLINLPYSIWKKTHEFMGLVLFFGALHILTITSDISRFQPLRVWIIVWLVIGAMSVVYRRWLYDLIGPRYKYVVDEVVRQGDVLLVYLKPTVKKMKYRGGQFVFAKFERLTKEQHPFSIASGPGDERLMLGIKMLGEDTLNFRELVAGDIATLWGPYGTFWEKQLSKKDLIWIAGGIGVTPFLSMLTDEINGHPGRLTDFFYCVGSGDEAVFDSQIKLTINSYYEKIHYWQFCSKDSGRITAKAVLAAVGSFNNKKIMLCGPLPMMNGLVKQFKELGVTNSQIAFEDFNFK